MTDGGRSGGTAQQKADRLRLKAEKLSRQADAWEAGTEGERGVARKLDELPQHYVILHDLQLPGSPTKIEHLVIGPGGIFMVDAKKYAGKLTYGKKMLWHGRFPISGKLDMVRWEAEYLSELVSRTVAPVMCFLDPVLPQPVTTLGGVIVCRASVLLTVVRSAHTMISEAEVHEIVEKLQPLCDASTNLLDANFETALWPMSGLDTTGPVALVSATAGDQSPPAPPRPPRPRRSMVLAFACLVAVAASAAVVLAISRWTGDPLRASPSTTSTTVKATTTTVSDTVAVTTTTLVDPVGRYRFVCPHPNAGWTVQFAWPGSVPQIVYYEFSLQNPANGDWINIENMMSNASSPPELHGLTIGEKRIVRITAAYSSGVAGAPSFIVIEAPEGKC